MSLFFIFVNVLIPVTITICLTRDCSFNLSKYMCIFFFLPQTYPKSYQEAGTIQNGERMDRCWWGQLGRRPWKVVAMGDQGSQARRAEVAMCLRPVGERLQGQGHRTGTGSPRSGRSPPNPAACPPGADLRRAKREIACW